MIEITQKFRDKEVRCAVGDGVVLINGEDAAALRGFDNVDEMIDCVKKEEELDYDQEFEDWQKCLSGMRRVRKEYYKLGEEFLVLSNRAIDSLGRFLVAVTKLHGMTEDDPQASLVSVQTLGYAADRDDSMERLYDFLKDSGVVID